MNQHSPLFDGPISLEYSSLLTQENTLAPALNAIDAPRTDSDACVPPPHSHPIPGGHEPCIPTNDCHPPKDTESCIPPVHTHPKDTERLCVPSEDGSCEAVTEKKYTAFPAVQSGWTFPAQPHA